MVPVSCVCMMKRGTCIGLAIGLHGLAYANACKNWGLHMYLHIAEVAAWLSCMVFAWYLHDICMGLHGICMVFAWELHAYASPMQVRETASDERWCNLTGLQDRDFLIFRVRKKARKAARKAAAK